MLDLADTIGEANSHDAVRVVVVRSASEKFFSAGADVKRFLANDVHANMEMISLAHEALASIARSPKLFVAWIAGHALGGGLKIALACDLRYAAEGSYRLGTPEVTLGLLPGNGGTQRLPRIIGRGPAFDLLLTGRRSARRGAAARHRQRPVRRRRRVPRARRASSRPGRRSRSRTSSARCTRASTSRSRAGWRSSASSSSSCSARGRQRGPDGVHREAGAEFKGA